MSGRRAVGRLARVARPVVVGRRDRVILHALAKARVMRTSDFTPLITPSAPIARRRLRRLHDAGLAIAVVTALHEDNRWVASAKGLKLVYGAEAPRAVSVARAVDAGAHHFMMVRFWACLARACFVSQTVKLARFSFEWELAPDERVNTLQVHRPDALFVLDAAGRSQGYLAEIDTGVESPSYVAAHKVAVGERLIATRTAIAGVVPVGLLILAPTARRLRALARAALGSSPRIMAAVFTETTPAMPVDGGWPTLASYAEKASESPARGGRDGR